MAEDIRVSPPLIAIEVLSPEDRLSRVLARLEDFWGMGVAHVWLLDPVERVAFTYSASGLKQVMGERIEVVGTPIYLDLVELFAGLD